MKPTLTVYALTTTSVQMRDLGLRAVMVDRPRGQQIAPGRYRLEVPHMGTWQPADAVPAFGFPAANDEMDGAA